MLGQSKKDITCHLCKGRNHILEFEESQFVSSGFHGDGQWILPIALAVGSYNKTKNLLSKPSREKVQYDDNLEAQLRKAVDNNCLSATDKFGILDDAYALCVAGKQPLTSLLSLIDVYRKELEYVVLAKLIDIGSKAVAKLANELNIDLLLPPAEKLGWESVPGESHFNTILRGEAAYIAVMRNSSASDRKGFESLLNVYRGPNTVLQEKELILRWLASFSDSDLVVDIMNFFVSDDRVRDQDIIYVDLVA
ncbi:Peptidase M1, alanine aminopeptidase/leukotriene A4 hydrolase [Trema orientale]|uniref:Peptidase M1, alanine aminopeptidase/leukotriene A4 hydrolase n=1 Tax=Trema orientale TaxID=63057 RepID=A0A2P5FW56_TREOI|nr:Peptidase M1, alanine aminopeptidase/leukotriene A4 hydrolase [Trema orientale]